MAETPKRGGPTLLTTSAAALQTAPTDATKWQIIRSILITNEDSVSRTFTLGINTAATDAAGKRTFAKDVSVAAGQSWEWSGYQPLFGHATTPDLVYGLASAASALTVTIGVVEGP